MISSLMIRDKIRVDYITSGKCGPGDKLPTIRDIAKEYGVSYVTALEAVRVLAQEGHVVKKQGSGVYVSPDLLRAERLATKKIGYITNSLAQKDAYGYKILDGIERMTHNKGYRLELANSNYDFEKEKKAVSKFVKEGVAGIILYPVPRKDSDIEYLADNFTDVPIVLADLATPEMQRSSVIFDNYNAGYEMVKYLIGKNKKKIVFIHNHLENTNKSVQDRILGCRKAIENDIAVGGDIEFSIREWKGNNFKCLHSELETLLSSGNHPDAIISCYDKEAAIVYFWLTANGFQVPSKVEVVGFDNIIPDFVPWLNRNEEYHYHWPTTNPDFTRLGERAAELLLEMIEKNCRVNKEILLPCPLLVQRHNIHIESFVGSSKNSLKTTAVPL